MPFSNIWTLRACLHSQAIFVMQLNAIFVVPRLHQVLSRFETPATLQLFLLLLVCFCANSRQFHSNFIAATLQETSCKFGATKIALSCMTKITCVNSP